MKRIWQYNPNMRLIAICGTQSRGPMPTENGTTSGKRAGRPSAHTAGGRDTLPISSSPTTPGAFVSESWILQRTNSQGLAILSARTTSDPQARRLAQQSADNTGHDLSLSQHLNAQHPGEHQYSILAHRRIEPRTETKPTIHPKTNSNRHLFKTDGDLQRRDQDPRNHAELEL